MDPYHLPLFGVMINITVSADKGTSFIAQRNESGRTQSGIHTAEHSAGISTAGEVKHSADTAVFGDLDHLHRFCSGRQFRKIPVPHSRRQSRRTG